MKFLYEYRTKDNAVHDGVVLAVSRDAAYAALKARGIKPARLTEAPGFFNHLFGKGKRWMVIAVLFGLCLTLCVLAVSLSRRARASRAQLDEAQSTMHEAQSTLQLFDSPTRRYPIGDAAVIAKGIRTGWADVFKLEGDRFLASFAIPGETPAVRSTTVEAVEACLDASLGSPGGATSMMSPDSLSRRGGIMPPRQTNQSSAVHPFSTSTLSPDSIEYRQILAIVSGMKDELRRFLAAGGSITQYGRLLVRRQEEEIGYYTRAKAELESAISAGRPKADIEDLWETNNDRLRKMGIKLVPYPDSL